jgi:hypothetical protein
MPRKRTPKEPELPPQHDWRTSDTDEVRKRVQRAKEETFQIQNLEPEYPVFSNFRVKSSSGIDYSVEIRNVIPKQVSCSCVDFRINRLGTCKHGEAVLMLLGSRLKKLFKTEVKNGPARIEIVPDLSSGRLRLIIPASVAASAKPVRELWAYFDTNGLALSEVAPEEILDRAEKLRSRLPALRISQEVGPWLENLHRGNEALELRREYEQKVQSGEWPLQETKVPLFPYQREGMLHLAFKERALLADEMGLGKTIQSIAASVLLHRLGKARRVLVVTPASLKAEWEEQIRRFTDLPLQIVYGNRRERVALYSNAGDPSHNTAPCFFTIVNYEQMVSDALDVNAYLQPDVVILDEAQRIKNWSTKTARAVKRLNSRYAFVLTGTPIENRIDELHSLMDFLNPSVLGPLFRFNRDFYDLDARGRPLGFRNLHLLHERVKPYMLRRRKAEVETELPERTDRNHFVPLSEGQKSDYGLHEAEVMKLASIAERRPLTVQEQEKLLRELAMMRMICDTSYILDPEDRTCPKLAELEKIFEECAENGAKVIVFSEWERMLDLVRDLCKEMGIGYAWHTGSVPQQRRRKEINAFKSDPKCRVFLSTDSGATGLNLQTASVVVNCDLPWNPAKLEQRIARAWRKHQTQPVTVINLISENTIEHRMLDTLATKQTLAASVLDKPGEVTSIKLRGEKKGVLARLEQLITRPLKTAKAAPSQPTLSSDPSIALTQLVSQRLGSALVRCEERFPQMGPHTVVLVVVDKDVNLHRERVVASYRELTEARKIDPLAPMQVEVIDEAMHEALQRLIGAGVLAKTTRATRQLFPLGEGSAEEQPLTPEELAKVSAHREKAGRAREIAKVLAGAGFNDEVRKHLTEAIHRLGSAFAIRLRSPEPASAADALLPPISHCWGSALASLRNYLSGNRADPEAAIKALGDVEQ